MDFDFSDTFDFDADDTETHVTDVLKSPVQMRKEAKRAFISASKIQALKDVVTELPPPGVDLWIISNGDGTPQPGFEAASFEYGHFVPVLAAMMGRGVTAYMSTWSLNRDHALALFDLLDTGILASLSFVTDKTLRNRKHAISAELFDGLKARKQRYLTYPNHAKILALKSADGKRTCVVFGSANLSQQPRAENYVLTTDPAAYEWVVRDFFEVLFDAQRKN